METISEQIREQISNAMLHYISTKKMYTLINTLLAIEKHIKGNNDNDKSLWFRFFPGDTTATTIHDLKVDLSLGSSHPNYHSMLEKIQIGVEGNSIRVYYS